MWKKWSALFLVIVFVAATTPAVFAYGYPRLQDQQSALQTSSDLKPATVQHEFRHGQNIKEIVKEQGLSKETKMQKRMNQSYVFRFSLNHNEALANLFGMNSATLQKELASGQSLAQLAKEKQVSLDRVQAVLLDQMKEKLSSLVQDGRLTKEQMAEKLAQFEANLPKMLEQTCDRSSSYMSKRPSKHAPPANSPQHNAVS